MKKSSDQVQAGLAHMIEYGDQNFGTGVESHRGAAWHTLWHILQCRHKQVDPLFRNGCHGPKLRPCYRQALRGTPLLEHALGAKSESCLGRNGEPAGDVKSIPTAARATYSCVHNVLVSAADIHKCVALFTRE